MAVERTASQISPRSELGRVVRQAAAGEAIVVQTGEVVDELGVAPVAQADAAADGTEPDALLGIIGIGSSAEPTSIARDKDRELAAELDPRRPR